MKVTILLILFSIVSIMTFIGVWNQMDPTGFAEKFIVVMLCLAAAVAADALVFVILLVGDILQ